MGQERVSRLNVSSRGVGDGRELEAGWWTELLLSGFGCGLAYGLGLLRLLTRRHTPSSLTHILVFSPV